MLNERDYGINWKITMALDILYMIYTISDWNVFSLSKEAQMQSQLYWMDCRVAYDVIKIMYAQRLAMEVKFQPIWLCKAISIMRLYNC